MPEYITASDVQNRLTPTGYEFVADRDLSGTGVTSDEVDKYVTPAIKYAGAIVDSAVTHFVDTSDARNAANQWLKDRCLDLAVYHAAQHGGGDVPQSIKDAREFSLDLLKKVGAGEMRVPDLVYDEPPDTGKSVRGPRTHNVR